MPYTESVPLGVRVSSDIEHRPDRPSPYHARVRWFDPVSKRRKSLSEGRETLDQAEEWISGILQAAQVGITPNVAIMSLAEYGASNMDLALRGLELKTLDPYLAGWRCRVVPALGHFPVRMINNGAVDRTVHGWIADQHSRSTVKNSLAVLVRVMEQAVRDGIITVNPARVTGWQREYKQAEDELDNPRALALRDWPTPLRLAQALTDRSHDHYRGRREVVVFAAATAARIGEVSGVRACDIDTENWIWTIRRQTTPAPGGLTDKNTKGRRARQVPLIEEIRPVIAERILAVGPHPDARLFTGPRGGRISTAVLRDATHWDEVVTSLGHEHLRRHDLRQSRTHLVRRRRRPRPRPPQNRRTRLPPHHPALPPPRHDPDHQRRPRPHRTPQPHPHTPHPRRPAGSRTAPLEPVVPNWSPRNTERRYRISPIPPATCENTSRDDRI
ncbi:tyrosine-type recombinase/integrase [Streptomyces atratus]|uniref:tyrosine-type recombinase/integrase n=1 Tax=Streptomyces atratus TaxID=1893 RepID=UPI0036668ADA